MSIPELSAPGGRPLVLLPVRLETRYTGDRRALRVRIFPDDIHIDRLDRGLDPAEAEAGGAYWQALLGGTPSEVAFATLSRAVRPDRAAWVAATAPISFPEFPERPFTAARSAQGATGREHPAPVARGLPGRFVAALYSGDILVCAAAGDPVPDELVVGPAPGGAIGRDGPSLGAGTRWAVDYAEALRVGMAITVPLPAEVLAEVPGPLRLLVFGVGADPGRGQETLELLLTAHRYTSGLEFLRTGTPTNNTETDRSGWSHRHPPVPPELLGTAPPPDADGPLLATALGIGNVLYGAEGSERRSQRLAWAAHSTLWPASLGAFLDTVVQVREGSGPIMGDETRERLRETYQNVVRGRGPLPSLRIGRQPYGMLPVVATGTPVEVAGAPPGLQRVLNQGRAILSGSAAPTAAEDLLEVLGTAPTCLGLRMRSVLPDLDELLKPLYVDPLGDDAHLVSGGGFPHAELTGLFGLDFGRLGTLRFGSVTRPLRLPLVHDSDAEYAASLAAEHRPWQPGDPFLPLPRSIVSVLQALMEIAAQAELMIMSAATGDATPPDVPADAAGLHALADRLARENGYAGPSLLATYQPVKALLQRTPLLAEANRQGSARMAEEARQIWSRARARLMDLDTAMAELTAAPPDERATAVAEALDCVSHRLDAWLTSLATDRLTHLRRETPTGLTLGAYGWVENLPGPGAAPPPAGGYIHAPSQAHAATAGVLRSAALAHSATGTFAVDLSSARVRTALKVLDAVRQGQPLGAVIGYRIERALGERGLGRVVRSLRILAPLGEGTTSDPSSAAAVTGVLDGVRLLDLPRPDIHAALRSPPADNPYLDGGWTPPDGALLDEALDEGASACDAVADLMLAESVHQLTSGGMARAAASLDAAGGGDVPPPDPDVARTPTLGVPVTHRVLSLVTSSVSPWPAGTPRAQAEPMLERWAAARLGPPSAIGVGSGRTLDQARISALDVVHGADDLTGLLRTVAPGLPVDPEPLRPVAELARSLRTALAGARPLTPDAFDLPGRPAPPDLTELETRIREAGSRLAQADSLRTLALHGIDVTDPDAARAEAARRVDRAAAAHDPYEAARELFGPGFVVVPKIDAALPLPAPCPVPSGRIRAFLRDAATVRDSVAAYAETLLFADAAGRPPRLQAVQLGMPDGPARPWVALPFDGGDRPPPDAPVTSLLLDGPADLSGAVGGLLVDEWVEVVPRRRLGPDGRPLLASGVAVHADAPGAQPPQAVLIAVTPDGRDWTFEQVADTLTETLRLARLRLVTLERSELLGWLLPAWLSPTFSLGEEKVLDLKYLAERNAAVVPIPYVNDSGG